MSGVQTQRPEIFEISFYISSVGQNSSVSVWDIRNSKTLKRFPAGSFQAEALLSQRGSQDGAAGVKSALGLVSLVASNQKSSALVLIFLNLFYVANYSLLFRKSATSGLNRNWC